MKKTPLILFFILFLSVGAYAQKNMKVEKSVRKTVETQEAKPPAKLYLGLTGGLNNQCGLFGLSLELPVNENVSIGSGIGNSTWGNKVYLEARYYFQPNFKGWAIGGGVTHSTGLDALKTSLPTIDNGGNNEDVTLHMQNVTNAFVAGYRVWKMGRNRNRFYIELGYSVPLGTPKYSVTSGQTLTNTGDKTVKLLAPGGLIAALGFSFALL